MEKSRLALPTWEACFFLLTRPGFHILGGRWHWCQWWFMEHHYQDLSRMGISLGIQLYIYIYTLYHSHLNPYYNLMMVDTTVYDISTIIGIYIIRIKDVNITSNYNISIMVDLPIIEIFHMSTIIHIFHPDHTPKGAWYYCIWYINHHRDIIGIWKEYTLW